MNDLLKTIANDLSILPYTGESSADYCYRVCYSALAYHLLCTGKSSNMGVLGTSKRTQYDTIQRLIEQYETLLGLESSRLSDRSVGFCQHIRRVYEETGYLITDERDFDAIATYGRTIQTEMGHLYFGIPGSISAVCGLGVYTDTPSNDSNLFETFLRDTLSVDEYIAAMFNPLDFEDRDINYDNLEFFNPSLKRSPSSSWGKELRTRRTVARTDAHNSLYRVICESSGRLLYADEPFDIDKEKLTSFETRRLYIALKEQYGEPVIAQINQLDERYCEIRLTAHLPTREYYFLLLSTWPRRTAFDKIRFIANSSLLPTIEKVLNNIGVKTIWRNNHA